MGSNPAVYWMDVSDASCYYICNEKKKKEVTKWGTPKKIIEKKEMNFLFVDVSISR